MDVVPKIVIEIARQVVPDEIYQASLIAENFAKGGKARKELLQQTRAGELGGWGGGEAAVLPWILHAISISAPFLAGLLTSKTLDNAGIIIKEIHAALNPEKSLLRPQKQSIRQQSELSLSPQQHIPDAPKLLQQCVVALEKALQQAGLPSEESAKIAYKVILILWEDAPNSIVFLRKITEKK